MWRVNHFFPYVVNIIPSLYIPDQRSGHKYEKLKSGNIDFCMLRFIDKQSEDLNIRTKWEEAQHRDKS